MTFVNYSLRFFIFPQEMLVNFRLLKKCLSKLNVFSHLE
jgi:hypothetical protein